MGDKIMIRVKFDHNSYYLLQGWDREGKAVWRLSLYRVGEPHKEVDGEGRQQGVDTLANAMQQLTVDHLNQLEQELVRAKTLPDHPRGFRPGYRARESTRLLNQTRDFLSRMRKCAAQTGAYLVEEGWPVPTDRELGREHPLVFAPVVVCASAS